MDDPLDVAEMLTRDRPDRYKQGERDWQQHVVNVVAQNIDSFKARQLAAEQIVSRTEASATRRTNKFMREIIAHDGLPLDWMDRDRWPLVVGDHRVCLGALTPEDIELFTLDEEARANKDHQARMDCVQGARRLRDQMLQYRCGSVRDLGRKLYQ